MISTLKVFKMIKKIGLWVSSIALLALQSCSVNTETTYFKDSASSMKSNILMDKGMLSMMNMMGNGTDNSPAQDLSKLSTDWKSLYEIQKDGLSTSTKIL